jgi:hypothetical protein
MHIINKIKFLRFYRFQLRGVASTCRPPDFIAQEGNSGRMLTYPNRETCGGLNPYFQHRTIGATSMPPTNRNINDENGVEMTLNYLQP